jgi:hypothetical protein
MAVPDFPTNVILSHVDLPPYHHAGKADKHCHVHVSANDNSSIDEETSPLLLLPREIRLKIWQYILIKSSRERLVLRIMRRFEGLHTSSKRFSNLLYKHVSDAEIKMYFEDRSTFSISINLLQTTHYVYDEAIPGLYQSIVFRPWNLQGIFPLFLKPLSTPARSPIRYVRLDTSTGCDTDFQQILVEAAAELKAKALVHRQLTTADAMATENRSGPTQSTLMILSRKQDSRS